MNLNKYKKHFILIIVAIFVILDWLALDDITTGSEPTLLGEYLILLISIFVFAGAIYFWRKPN